MHKLNSQLCQEEMKKFRTFVTCIQSVYADGEVGKKMNTVTFPSSSPVFAVFFPHWLCMKPEYKAYFGVVSIFLWE